jgi:hypothetical protein
MKDKKSLEILLLVVLLLLAISAPLQYLVRKEVVVGLPSDFEHHHEEETTDQAAEAQSYSITVTNFGFEVGTREQIWGWSQAGGDQGAVTYRDDNVARRGFASASVNTNGVWANDAGWITKMDELPLDKDLVFSGYVRTEDLNGEAYVEILCQGSLPDQEQQQLLVSVSSDDRHGTNDWSLTSVECHIPPEASGIWLEVGVFGTGHAWFDDLSLEVKDRRDDLQIGQNLLKNPSLADGASSWHAESTTPNPAIEYGQAGTGPDGTPAFLLKRSNAGPGDLTALHQSLSGFYGHQGTLTLSGRMRCEGLSGSAFLGVRLFRPDGYVALRSADSISGNSGWKDFTMAVGLDGSVEDLWFSFNMEGSGSVYVSGLQAVFEESPAGGQGQ